MGVHAAAVVFEDWLRHERHALAMTLRDVLADVLVPHELIGHREERLELHVDLALAGRRDLMMVRLDDDADLAHLVDHLAAQIVERVGGAHRKVPALEARLVAEIRLLDSPCVPGALGRVDLVIAVVLVLLVANLVEDEEFGFRPDVTRVRNAAFLQVRLGLPGDVSRIARELLPVTGSTMFAMTLTVGLAKNGSSRAVSATGTASMSDSWIPIQPRIDEPSKPRPSSKVSASRCSTGNEQCCQLPSRSTNFRSTISAW